MKLFEIYAHMPDENLEMSNNPSVPDLTSYRDKPLQVPVKVLIEYVASNYKSKKVLELKDFIEGIMKKPSIIYHEKFQGSIIINFEYEITEQSQLDILFQCEKNLQSKFDIESIDSGVKVYISEVPSFFVDTQIIRIKPFKEITLTGLDKKINPYTINLSNIDLITGNVLGILKMPRLQYLFYNSSDKTKWCNIIKSYIDDKNILKCQRELIQNGLKDYAKF